MRSPFSGFFDILDNYYMKPSHIQEIDLIMSEYELFQELEQTLKRAHKAGTIKQLYLDGHKKVLTGVSHSGIWTISFAPTKTLDD
jgi:hypothetical protein